MSSDADLADPQSRLKVWKAAWETDISLIQKSGRLLAPWSSRPVYTRPSDAVALRYWYRASAAGDWCNIHALVELLPYANEKEWAQQTLPLARSAAFHAQRVTHGLHDAAIYWLPPGHAAAHADSEPLADDAATDLRLPFGTVLLCFADPLLMPPIEASPPEGIQHQLLRSTAAVPGPDMDPRRLTWDSVMMRTVRTAEDAATRKGSLASVWSLIRYYGAAVEALLLFADRDGVPTDDFAWCLALTDPGSGRILGRELVFGRRSLTAHRTIVDNMIAVVSWADWHRDESDQQTRADGIWEQSADRGSGVHVLDARSIRGRSAHDGGPSGLRLRPHRRRGYWRRQHYGPSNRDIKWVRIPPTVVNAHSGPLGWQVYRLPGVDGNGRPNTSTASR
ncbi:hypothetical protein [Actinopolymorpha pittospori]|uniref:Uncharacterized protein n=1 Tax=Actinopolymorpha pittospori TaxID=648752 RepID=A0A927MQ75_9ACTN|nr:hypothetical protein [Actinopolymorpha pittospori]MBE1604192.1 hypothetical protein [Actinopolymorpha pittospori]